MIGGFAEARWRDPELEDAPPIPTAIGLALVVARPKVEPATPLSPEQKPRMSFDLFAYGCELMRQNLRRAHPAADDEAIDDLLQAWLRERPGAEHGNAVGRPGTWPRRPDARHG